MVATVTVDGLNVANTFSIDKNADGQKTNWPGWFVPAQSRFVIHGWLYSVDPAAKKNVLPFRIAEFGEGESTVKARRSNGVVTVQFREASTNGKPLTSRCIGETTHQLALQERPMKERITIGSNVLSTVSIRYNRAD